MFVLATISDLVQIQPKDFEKQTALVIKDSINEKYANKVVQKLGLCICLFDIIKTSDGLIGNGNGLANVNVIFRLVVFRPFKGEVLRGLISGSDENGIQISLDFFGDITVPAPVNLFDGCTFLPSENVWVWKSDAGGDFYFDLGEVVRFRVEAEEWHDQTPQGPNSSSSYGEEEMLLSPYTIIGSMQTAGLGLTSWWESFY